MSSTDKYLDVYYGQGEREQGTDFGQLYVDTNTYNVYLTDRSYNMHQVGYTDIDIRMHDQYYETMKSLADAGVLTSVQIVPYGQTRLVKSAEYITDTVAENVSIIVLPSTITAIGASCCRGYSNLTSIKIPPRVTSIGDYAFEGTSVKNIVIPDYVVELGSDVFNNCSELTSLYIGKSVETIQYNNDGAYLGDMPSLMSLQVDLKNKTYTSCSLSSISPEESEELNCLIEKDSNVLLHGCNRTKLSIDIQIQEIAARAFFGLSDLSDIIIPQSVEFVGESCFEGCSSVKYLHTPFIGKSKEDDDSQYLGYLFGASHYKYNEDYVPASLVSVSTYDTEIKECAFANCSHILSVSIPYATIIGNGAFAYCEGLIGVYLSDSIVNIGEDAFFECKNLGDGVDQLIFRESLESIGDRAFYGTAFNCVEFRGGNEIGCEIGNEAFANMRSLISITLSDVILGNDVFGGSSVTTIRLNIDNIIRRTSNTTTKAFNHFGELFYDADRYDETEGVTEINARYSSYSSNKYYKIPQGEIEVYIKTSGNLSKGLFSGCSNLVYVHVEIPTNSNLTIEEYCFNNCISLETLILEGPGGNTFNIGTGSFMNTLKLQDINFNKFNTKDLIGDFGERTDNKIAGYAFDRNSVLLKYVPEYAYFQDTDLPKLPSRIFNFTHLKQNVPIISNESSLGQKPHYSVDSWKACKIVVSSDFESYGSFELELPQEWSPKLSTF